MQKEEIYQQIKGEEIVKKAFMELLDMCENRPTNENEALLISAFNFAYDAHDGIKRKSGEPFILHPITVGKIVVKEIGLENYMVIPLN